MRQEHWKEMRRLWGQIRAKRNELATARRAGDKAKVETLTREPSDLYAEQAERREEFASM